MYTSDIPVYYAGFDPGSGISGLIVLPADDRSLDKDLVTLPSFIANGDLTKLLASFAPDATLPDILREDQYVLVWQNHTYFLGNLLDYGDHADNAFGDENRYHSLHSQVLLLCLACILIPERRFELRLVTALPVKLYDRERREEVRKTLSQTYHFAFNGYEREVIVKCGYVAMEGQGILIHHGDEKGDLAVIDIGERTTDLITAKDQKPIVDRCKGADIGVGNLVNALEELARRHKRHLPVEKAHEILKAYAHSQPYPTIKTPTGSLDDSEIIQTIEETIERDARTLSSLISSTWYVDKAPAGSQFDTIYLGGGGAYYFEQVVRSVLRDCAVETVPDPENANILGYVGLAISLNEERWDVR